MYKEKFCFYCGKYRDASGFWKTIKSNNGSTRKQCPIWAEARRFDVNNKARIKPA